MDGAFVLDDLFHRARPRVLNAPMLARWGVGLEGVTAEVRAAIEEWRALPAPKAWSPARKPPAKAPEGPPRAMAWRPPPRFPTFVRSDDISGWTCARRTETPPTPYAVARFFERRILGFLDFEQLEYPRRQLQDGVPVVLSRTDRVSMRIPRSHLGSMTVMAFPFGGVLVATNPTDHAPVSVKLFRWRRRSQEFQETPSALVHSALRVECPFGWIGAFKAVFRCAAEEATQRMAQNRTLLGSNAACHALRMLRAHRRGDSAGVRRAAFHGPLVCGISSVRHCREGVRRGECTSWRCRVAPTPPSTRRCGSLDLPLPKRAEAAAGRQRP